MLASELGPATDEIIRAFHFAVANALRHGASLREVAAHASSRAISIVLLKGGALHVLGLAAPGSRSFSDLDILIPIDRIPELRSALVGAGWTLSPRSGSEHQEPPLTHPSLGMIELHRFIPGVRPMGRRRSYDAGSLLEDGLSVAAPEFDESIRTPARSVLVAHALAHGLFQHGYAAGTYPLFRCLADLQDLGAGRAELSEAGQFLRDFDSADLDAVFALLSSLDTGSALELADGSARSLLHHLVGIAMNADYALSLKANPRFLRSPTDLPPSIAMLRSLYSATVLTRAQVDIIYGPPRRWGGYAARQLLRPLDLVLRLGRSIMAREP